MPQYHCDIGEYPDEPGLRVILVVCPVHGPIGIRAGSPPREYCHECGRRLRKEQMTRPQACERLGYHDWDDDDEDAGVVYCVWCDILREPEARPRRR